MGDDGGEDSDDGDEEPIITYRVEAPKSDWQEFKTNVPHSIKLGDKILELIQRFNEEQRQDGEDNDNCV
jgi:hypothetical protein